jgi:hypothetical protein
VYSGVLGDRPSPQLAQRERAAFESFVSGGLAAGEGPPLLVASTTTTWFERKLDFFEHFKRPKFFILGKFCTHPPCRAPAPI